MGVNVTERLCEPAPRIDPLDGEYEKVPETFAVAFNCVELNAVPYVMDAGFDQLIVGLVLFNIVNVPFVKLKLYLEEVRLPMDGVIGYVPTELFFVAVVERLGEPLTADELSPFTNPLYENVRVGLSDP